MIRCGCSQSPAASGQGRTTRPSPGRPVDLAPSGVEVELFDGLGELPHFDADLEGDDNAAVRHLRERIDAADAVLFVTPEYNGSIPGVLKNAIDWASRPR